MRCLTNVSVLADNRLDGAVEPFGRVDRVGQQVARHARPAVLTSSRHRAAPPWGTSCGDRPVLQIGGPIMERSSDTPFVDHLFGQRDGRHAAVVEGDHVRHARLLDRLAHLFRFGHAHGQRFFADDRSCRLRPPPARSLCACCWACRFDVVDVVAFDQLSPVGFVRFVAPLVRRTPSACLRAPRHKSL